jgi:hypothetical protein
MGEDVRFRPADQIEFRAHRQEIEAGLREFASALTFEAQIQLLPEPVKIEDV